ncbi:MAG TPA: aminoacyl-tRNA hydrolase [Thermodesulfovibrionales bacterium]|nr:aminoacyl-tRNA hydrolase [Thermodesulfovibrionales bacterium]
MWIIVGLGNPGRRYYKTRHNVGFMVADEIADRHGIALRDKESYLLGKGSIEGNDVILVEPLTFMNLSGLAARDVIKRYSTQPGNLIVIHDDIDMETGKLKIRKKGSSGGHKGVESVIEFSGTREFIRVRVGIGREEGAAVEDYVLSKFREDEIPVIKDAIIRAADAVEMIIISGIEKAMNKFN